MAVLATILAALFAVLTLASSASAECAWVLWLRMEPERGLGNYAVFRAFGNQRECEKYYSKWLGDMRKNHRDDIDKDVRHMQDIMGRLQHTRQHPFRSNRIPGCSTTLTR